jgi:aminoglycoside phosphotransferase (APT) family kinase protein
MWTDATESGTAVSGTEVPLAALQNYLRSEGVAAGPIAIERCPGGHSNLTYLLRAGAEEWVLRRRPVGRLPKHAHDMHREFRVLSRLSPVYELAPRPILYCDDEGVIGAPFYIMERRHGVILRGTASETIADSDRGTLPRLCRALVENLVRLHALDYGAAGLGDLGRPGGYLSRQVHGWRRRYADAQTDVVPEVDRIADWLADNVPTESRAALVHNDYKFDNIVVDTRDPTRIVGVLDWEMATIGDPLADLGTTLALWIQATDPEPLRQAWVSPTVRPESLTRREIVELYGEFRGEPVTRPLLH